MAGTGDEWDYTFEGSLQAYGFLYRGYSRRRALCLIFDVSAFDNPADNFPPGQGDIYVRSAKQSANYLGIHHSMVKVFRNQTRAQIEATCREQGALIRGRVMKEMLVIFFGGHGLSGHRLLARDGDFDPYEIMFPAFEKQNAPNLAGRPKLFFVDACSGPEVNFVVNQAPLIAPVALPAPINPMYDPMIVRYTQDELDDLHRATPSGSDWTIIRAAVPGYWLTYARGRNSPFMEALEEVLLEAEYDDEIYKMFLKMQRIMENHHFLAPIPYLGAIRNIGSFFTSNRKELYPVG